MTGKTTPTAPPIEHRIVHKRIPKGDDDLVNVPPNARGVSIDITDKYYIVTYLSPTQS